ncbi:A1 cistron-splicing factor [Elsinoe ampelina]|uniref:A1 cistron-splicing factor n=1 Tax=Elsinoe ampelina TaxID=302913 RepID=A0A6A6GL01_9PEZI|nr:A1 cistron-splicing factor [Elsinoe ampelina]
MDEISPALLLIDLPSKALCGIDLLSFTTTPSFRGIKSLPPGLHFLFTAPHSTLAVRHGSWFSIPNDASSSPPALVLKQWDTATESLRPVTDPAAILSRRANLGSIWKTGMAPYRQRAGDHTGPVSSSDPNSFPGLTSSITADYLSHVFASPEEHWHLTSYTDTFSLNSALQSVPSTQTYEPEPPLHLLPIDLRRTWPSTATGRERTEAARDRSWYLLDICSQRPLSTAPSTPYPPFSSQSPVSTDLAPILAELQFTFLTSLTLNNFATLEQWRRLLRLVLTCRSAIPSHPTFFTSFLSTLQAQMQRAGDDELRTLFLEEEVDSEGRSFLAGLLAGFRKGVENGKDAGANGLKDVWAALRALEGTLFELYGWELDDVAHYPISSGGVGHGDGGVAGGFAEDGGEDEDDEDGEYAPAFVELTQEQMDELGIEGTPGMQSDGLGGASDEEYETMDIEDMDARF